MNGKYHLVRLRIVIESLCLIAKPEQLRFAIAFTDVNAEFDERLIHNITKRIRLRGIGSAFDGYGSLVVCVGRGAPGAVLLLYVHTDTAVRSDTVV